MNKIEKVNRVFMERISMDIDNLNLEEIIKDLSYCIIFFGLGDCMDDEFDECISKIRDIDKLNQYEDDLDWMISSIEILKEIISDQKFKIKNYGI